MSDYKLTSNGIERPFVPERDLFRLIKYGTYDLLELDELRPDIEVDLTDEEDDLICIWWNGYAPTMTHGEAFE